jgi:hypothetical protein
MPLLVKLRGMPWCEVTTPGFPRSISITSLASSKRPSSVEGQLEQVVAHYTWPGLSERTSEAA